MTADERARLEAIVAGTRTPTAADLAVIYGDPVETTGTGRPTGRRRPEYGDDVFDLTCDACGATWCGEVGMGCEWCERRERQLVEDQRAMLLHPHWLQTSAGDPRYDELSADDRAVWDRTRGQARGEDSIQAWERRLARAVEAGIVTEHEARRGINRMRRRHGSVR